MCYFWGYIIPTWPTSDIAAIQGDTPPLYHVETTDGIPQTSDGRTPQAYAQEPSGRFLSTIVNKTITDSKAPLQLKCSLTQPIPKKNKPTNIPANARGARSQGSLCFLIKLQDISYSLPIKTLVQHIRDR